MGKRLTYNIITGQDTRLGMCLYYSPHFGLNIWRRGSSLTGERTKKDPAFRGFRQSSNRLKEASPIAASLYKLVPEQIKQYALYRILTGEAIKMLKDGMVASVITETLKKKYIDHLLDASKNNSEKRTAEEPVTRDRIIGMTDFTSYPQITFRSQKNYKNMPLPFASKNHRRPVSSRIFFIRRFRSSLTSKQKRFRISN